MLLGPIIDRLMDRYLLKSVMRREVVRPIDDSFLDDLDCPSPVPPLTDWRSEHLCCGIFVNYVPAIKKRFLGHWEIRLCMPILVLFIIYSSLTVYLTCQLSPLPNLFGWKTTLYLLVTSFLFGFSYIQTIRIGPGYLPFYYPLANINGARDDSLWGMVTNDEQLYYVKNLALPERTGFFKSARRIVIRPDHFCSWTESFIGKKNHKLFFLFNFWGVAYVSAFSITTIVSIINLIEVDEHVFALIVCFIYTLLGLSFVMLTGSFVCSMLTGISLNETAFDGMKARRESFVPKPPTKGFIASWEEICGPRRKWYLWLLPVPAFRPFNDRNLVERRGSGEGRSFL
jgi:hypothetical protein